MYPQIIKGPSESELMLGPFDNENPSKSGDRPVVFTVQNKNSPIENLTVTIRGAEKVFTKERNRWEWKLLVYFYTEDDHVAAILYYDPATGTGEMTPRNP